MPELDRIVTSSIPRALGQQLAELEDWAKRSAKYALGRGKNGKGRDEAAMRIHDGAKCLSRLRNGRQGK